MNRLALLAGAASWLLGLLPVTQAFAQARDGCQVNVDEQWQRAPASNLYECLDQLDKLTQARADKGMRYGQWQGQPLAVDAFSFHLSSDGGRNYKLLMSKADLPRQLENPEDALAASRETPPAAPPAAPPAPAPAAISTPQQQPIAGVGGHTAVAIGGSSDPATESAQGGAAHAEVDADSFTGSAPSVASSTPSPAPSPRAGAPAYTPPAPRFDPTLLDQPGQQLCTVRNTAYEKTHGAMSLADCAQMLDRSADLYDGNGYKYARWGERQLIADHSSLLVDDPAAPNAWVKVMQRSGR